MTVPARRIALVSTPRVGNTWIRHLLGHAFALPTIGRHRVAADEWDGLPAECVLQVHQTPDPAFAEALARHGFHVVTVARHPLDVLISILHVVVYDVESENWLDGAGGNEQGLWGAWPTSRAFIDYSTGPRAATLLDVSVTWAARPGVTPVRYEDFVADPVGQLEKLQSVLGPLQADPKESVEKHTLAAFRKDSTNNHFWQGRPGLWRHLIPAAAAYEIAWSIRPVLASLGYPLDPDPDLSPAAADRNWLGLVGTELGATLRRNTTGHREQLKVYERAANDGRERAERATAERDEAVRAAEAAEAEQEAVRAELARQTEAATAERDGLWRELSGTQAERDEVRQQLDATRGELAVTCGERDGLRQSLADNAAAREAVEAALAGVRAELAASADAVAQLQSALADAWTQSDGLTRALSERGRELLGVRAAVASLEQTLLSAEREDIELRRELGIVRGQCERTRVERDSSRAEYAAAVRIIDRLRNEVAAVSGELAPYRGLQGLSVRWAWRLQRLRNRFPWAVQMLKSVGRR